MCRKINREAGLVTLVSDLVYGMRPQRIQWKDRWGSIHQVDAVSVHDQWAEAGAWWEESDGKTERRCWRLLLKRGGMITLTEDVRKQPGEPGYWFVEQVED